MNAKRAKKESFFNAEVAEEEIERGGRLGDAEGSEVFVGS